MTLICSLSQQVCKEPVISKKSGVIYEKKLILDYIEKNGEDPESGDLLTSDDLIAIKPYSLKYRPRTFLESSLPGLLSTFQNEWDALILELCTLRKEYENTVKELAISKLKNEAATRVVARLIKERDEAQGGLSQLNSAHQYGLTQAAQPVQEEASTNESQSPESNKKRQDTVEDNSKRKSKRAKKAK